MPHAKNIRNHGERVSHYHVDCDSLDVYERVIREGCEGTTLDYDLLTGARERPKRGKAVLMAVRLA